jgi:hypothetical protein
VTTADLRSTRRISRHLFPPLFAILLTSIAFFTTPVHRHVRGFDTDGAIYGAMAGSRFFEPSLARQAPYSYRVLTPYLASLLPWATLDSFRALAYVSNVLTLWILFLVLRKFDFSRDLCILGVLLYAGVFWTLKFSFYSPAYIDFQTQLFLLLIIWLTLSERYLVLLPILVLAALQKESLAAYALFVAAHVLRHRRRRGGLSPGLLLISLIALPAATLVLAQRLVPADNSYDALGVPMREISRLADPPSWPVLLQATFSGLGLIPPILIVRYRDCLAFLRTHVEWVVYLTISVFFLFGGEDKARLFLYGLPLLVLLSLQAAQALKASGGSRRFYIWALVAVFLHLLIGSYLTPMGSFDDYLGRMVPEHSAGRYRPFLIRNCAIAVAFLSLTVWLMRGAPGRRANDQSERAQ